MPDVSVLSVRLYGEEIGTVDADRFSVSANEAAA